MSANGGDHLPMYIINILHVFLQGLLLAYIGFMKEKTPKIIYIILALLALSIVISIDLPKLDFNLTYWNMVYLSHYILILPSLLYVSYIGYYSNFSSSSYDLIMWIGIFVMLYHGYKAINRLLLKPIKYGGSGSH